MSTPLLFVHANGFPPATYQPLLQQLASAHSLLLPELRPLWAGSQTAEVRNWGVLSSDLLQFLALHANQPVIGSGHSLGAVVTLRAAVLQPERFRSVILVDPVLLPPKICLQWAIAKLLRQTHRHPLYEPARKRRAHFKDASEMFQKMRRAKVFAQMSDEALQAYIHAATEPNPQGGIRLRYRPEWEAHIYRTNPIWSWRWLRGLRLPLCVIWGEHSNTVQADSERWLHAWQPKATFVKVAGATHLVPLEQPTVVAAAMAAFLNQNL
jgi:pimeloyl-ACP methyl ester carboxylesterase